VIADKKAKSDSYHQKMWRQIARNFPSNPSVHQQLFSVGKRQNRKKTSTSTVNWVSGMVTCQKIKRVFDTTWKIVVVVAAATLNQKSLP
jgi:hypothetical protein